MKTWLQKGKNNRRVSGPFPLKAKEILRKRNKKANTACEQHWPCRSYSEVITLRSYSSFRRTL